MTSSGVNRLLIRLFRESTLTLSLTSLLSDLNLIIGVNFDPCNFHSFHPIENKFSA